MSRRRARQEQEPTPPAPPPFVLLMVQQLPGGTPLTLQQTLYQIALQQAQEQAAAERPGVVERDWLGTWN